MRYSPDPLGSYKHAKPFKLLQDDPDAWNLAYLSWDWEGGPFPDAHLSANVWKTLMFVPSVGKVDLTKITPSRLTVRSMIRGPAPQVVYRLTNMQRLKETPMFAAYGQPWVTTMTQRSHMFREPYDEVLDADLTDLSDALRIIAKLR